MKVVVKVVANKKPSADVDEDVEEVVSNYFDKKKTYFLRFFAVADINLKCNTNQLKKIFFSICF